MSPPRKDGDLLQRVADQVESMRQTLSDFMASLERRLAPLDPMPAKIEKLEARVAALEAIEQQAKGAARLGGVLWAGLLGLGAAIHWLITRFTH